MFGPRAFSPGGALAEGDKFYIMCVFNGAAGALTIGKPVYADVTDAAEFNTKNTTTALSPAIPPTGGKVVLGTNANAGANLTCIGVFQPENASYIPNPGDPIRVLCYGRGVVSAQSPAAGAACNVGSKLVASAAVTDAVPGAAAAGQTIGTALATGTHVAAGNQILAAASAVATLINAFVNPC